MSTEHNKPGHMAGEAPRHSDVSFEERDIKVGTIYWYVVALGLATVAALLICVFVLHFTSDLAASSDAPPPPSREALGKDYRPLPPEPRLQGVPGHVNDPQKDLREKLRADNAANEKLQWLDKNAGIAQIPVKDAMKIVAEKGLPSFSQAPTGKEEKKK
jgi:hypothetical protein